MVQLQTHSTQITGLQILSEDEEILVDKMLSLLKDKSQDNHFKVQERLIRLRNLGNAVFDYPTIKDTRFIGDFLKNEFRFAESLHAFSTASHLLRTPTKVVALRSFFVAKFHLFSFLANLAEGNDEMQAQAKQVTYSIVFTLMAENVYFSYLGDSGFSDITKSQLANDLIMLWDSGTDPRSIRHFMALSSLWKARDSSPPSFGTMDGNTELLRISIDMEDETEWVEFLKEESTNNETRWALEEFMFGLSYEEILQVRNRLHRFGVSSISHKEVRTYLDSKPSYSLVINQDPRDIYDFFIERREACALRKRFNSAGPLHTLEEIYLKYRILIETE